MPHHKRITLTSTATKGWNVFSWNLSQICYNILNFRLCTIWLSLIFLIAHIGNLRIMVFLI